MNTSDTSTFLEDSKKGVRDMMRRQVSLGKMGDMSRVARIVCMRFIRAKEGGTYVVTRRSRVLLKSHTTGSAPDGPPSISGILPVFDFRFALPLGRSVACFCSFDLPLRSATWPVARLLLVLLSRADPQIRNLANRSFFSVSAPPCHLTGLILPLVPQCVFSRADYWILVSPVVFNLFGLRFRLATCGPAVTKLIA